MKLTVIGYLGGYPAHGDATSSYLLESDNFKLLLDCGSGALLSLEEVADPLSLNAVLLTHYHSDHIADVGVLQYYWQLHANRHAEQILPIYGNTADKVHFAALDWPGSSQGLGYYPEETLQLGPFEINFFRTQHPVVAYAVRIIEIKTGKVVVFTADTRYFEGLTAFCQNADLLMADTNFFAAQTGKLWHMTSTQSGKLAKDSRSKKLLLTHLPAVGDLKVLRAEALKACGNSTPVLVASKHLTLEV